MAKFNNKYFPSPEFKYDIEKVRINEDNYAKEKERKILTIYNNLVKKYNIKLEQSADKTFLDKWYIKSIRREIHFAFNLINKVKNK